MEVFEVHITGNESIINNALKLSIKTIEIDLVTPTREYFRTEYMTSQICKFPNYKDCKEHVDSLVFSLKELGTEIKRVKIECPYYDHYINDSLYVESHFEALDNTYPMSRNRRKTTYLATDRSYNKEEYKSFAELYKDKELELCLHDTDFEEDLDWFSLYRG